MRLVVLLQLISRCDVGSSFGFILSVGRRVAPFTVRSGGFGRGATLAWAAFSMPRLHLPGGSVTVVVCLTILESAVDPARGRARLWVAAGQVGVRATAVGSVVSRGCLGSVPIMWWVRVLVPLWFC